MEKKKKLILFGLEDFAQIAHEYFTYDSPYDVVAFTANRAYITGDTFMDKPLVPFEDLPSHYSPTDHAFFAAITYGNINRLRAQIAQDAQKVGYTMASYVSTQAFVWRNVEMGEHCFIFEDNTLQPFVKLGKNVVLWSGNHIGHHSVLADNCFLTSHVVVSGWCTIGQNCFIGVNTTLANNTTLGDFCWVGHGATLSHNIPARSLVKPNKSEVSPLDEDKLLRVLQRSRTQRKTANPKV